MRSKPGWFVALRHALLASLLIGSGAAWAECSGATIDQASCVDVRITLLYVDANTDAYITVSGNTNLLPCTASGGFLKLSSGSANFKPVYALLLAAHLSSRIVNVRLAPIASACTITYVTLP